MVGLSELYLSNHSAIYTVSHSFLAVFWRCVWYICFTILNVSHDKFPLFSLFIPSHLIFRFSLDRSFLYSLYPGATKLHKHIHTHHSQSISIFNETLPQWKWMSTNMWQHLRNVFSLNGFTSSASNILTHLGKNAVGNSTGTICLKLKFTSAECMA